MRQHYLTDVTTNRFLDDLIQGKRFGILNGESNRNDRLYCKAIQVASKEHLFQLKCRAMVYLAREELLAHGLSADSYRQEAIQEGNKLNDPALNVLIQRLEKADLRKIFGRS